MSFAPTYQDYQNNFANLFDDSGRFQGMTPEMWAALNPQDQWAQLGGSAELRHTDPRYAGLKPTVGGEADRDMFLTNRRMGADDVYTQADLGNGVFAHSQDQQTPGFQARAHSSPYMAFALPLAFMALPALLGEGPLAGAFGGASGADAGATGAFDMGGSTGFGDVFGGAAGDIAPGALPTIPETTLNPMNTSLLDSFGGEAGLAPVIEHSVNAGLGDTLRNFLPSALQGLVPSSLTGLLQGAGAITSLTGLLGGNHGGSSSASGNDGATSGGDKGGSGKGLNIGRSPYQPNPITQQQLQNFTYARPRGLGGM